MDNSNPREIVANALAIALRDTAPQKAYEAYCKQAGGVTFDGKPLPTWAELGEERRACWLAAAATVVSLTAHAVRMGQKTLRGF